MAKKRITKDQALEILGAVTLKAAREIVEVLHAQFVRLEYVDSAKRASDVAVLLAANRVDRKVASSAAYRVLQTFLREWKGDKRLKPDDLERAATFLELLAKEGGDLTLAAATTIERLARIEVTGSALFGSPEKFEKQRSDQPPPVVAAIAIALVLQYYGAYIEPIEKDLEKRAQKRKGVPPAERSRIVSAFQAFLANNMVLFAEEKGLYGADNAACRDALAHGDFEILGDGQVRTWMSYKRGPVHEVFTDGAYLLNLGLMFGQRNLMLHVFVNMLAFQLLFEDRLPPNLRKILPGLEDALRLQRNRGYEKLLASLEEEE